MSDTLCLISLARRCAGNTDRTGEQHVPFRATEGLTCRPCRDRLEQLLAELPALMADLTLMLHRQGKAETGRVSGTGEEPPFVADRVVQARADLLGKACSWARVICEDRGFTPPEPSPQAVAVFLVRNVDWLVRQPFIDEMAAEMEQAVLKARRYAYPGAARRVPLGDCPEKDCVGELSAFVRATDDLLPSKIVCDANEAHTWPVRQWITLGKRIFGEVA